jgi:diguanylate cyclase (GGDEF)-like protein
LTSHLADPDRVALAAIWDEHRPSMLGRVELLGRAAEALADDALAGELELDAGHAAHQLAGAAGTFGFWTASEHARAAESILRGGTSASPAQSEELSQLVVSLRAELKQPPFQATADLPDDHGEEAPLVLLIDDDETLTVRLGHEAQRRGMRVKIAPTVAQGRELAALETPDAVLLDLGFGSGTDEAMELVSDFSGWTPPVPVLLLTVHDGFDHRIEAARRGAVSFLEKTLSPSDAMDQVSQTLDRKATVGMRVMAVDDDPAVLAAVASVLSNRGLHVTTLDDPLRFWDELRRVAPDLLLLDVDMPGASGIELCRMLRSDPHWAAIPVLVLTAHRDPETVQRVFASGADDYLLKPLVGADLVTRVENRLDRFRLHQTLAENDALTGLANRRTAKAALGQLIRVAGRSSEAMCLTELDLDNFKHINDRYGHQAGDAALRRLADLLRRSFRGEDVICRWGGEEFVVGMYGLTRDAGIARIEGLLAAFRKETFTAAGESFNVTFSAGVSGFPIDGDDLETLYRSADEALYRAKAAGRDRVSGAVASTELPEEVVDVVIIEDDAATAEVLSSALEARGYRWRRFSDGARAVTALCGTSPVTRASLVVLDVEVPTLDGFGVLRRMAQDGILRTTRVLMLTGRATEEDVLRVLEMGAFDHVAKPFSVPVLMQKISRALAR